MIQRVLLASALALLVILSACSDDDPVAPPPDPGEDGVILIPGEVASLADAVAMAADGDTLKIAGGAYDGNITVTKQLVIMAQRDDISYPIIVTSDGPFGVELNDGRVELSNLAFSGGETGLALELQDSEVAAQHLHFSNVTHGITVDGNGGNLLMANVTFQDCGNDNGNGAGVRVWGDNWVSLQEGTFNGTGLGSGVAATVSDNSELYFEGAEFNGLDAGNTAVTACTGSARMIFAAARFEHCVGTMIHGGGETVGLINSHFVDCTGTLIRLQSEDVETSVMGCRVSGCNGTAVDVGAGQEPMLIWCSFIDHQGTLFDVVGGTTLELTHCTVVGSDGPVVSAVAGAQVSVTACVVVDAGTPVVDGGTIGIVESDFWLTAADDAWAGLEAYLGVDGNIEADPLFCDAAAGVYLVSESSPCILSPDRVMGAFGPGCQ